VRDFCHRTGRRFGRLAAAEYVASLDISAASKKTYVSHLVNALAVEKDPLRMMARGLSRMAAEEPVKQAQPITTQQLATCMTRMTRRDAALLFLAWKTASRWAEVSKLTKRNFLSATPEELVIRWLTTVKTHKTTVDRATNFTVVVPRPDAPWQRDVMKYIANLIKRLRVGEKLTTMTTQQLVRQLKQVDDGLSAHSIKRGALTYLIEHAAELQIPQRSIPLLAKHRDYLNEVPAATLRYCGNQAALARWLGTQEVTRHL
jgi:hypothetical protein